MPIPINIQREHIIQAISQIDREGIPSRREARKWALNHEGSLYPLKLIISLANSFINGQELDPNPNNFTSQSAKKHLKDLDFTVEQI
jgi:hypothetical protein